MEVEEGQKPRNVKSVWKLFLKPISEKKMQPRYCSKKCSSLATETKVEIACALCSKIFKRQKSKVNILTRNYCGPDCLANANRNEIGQAGGNSCRDKAKSARDCTCQDCGENREFLIVCHHIDGDHSNNPLNGSNWEILCCNCHALRHLAFINSRWIYKSSSLTPRNLIKEISAGNNPYYEQAISKNDVRKIGSPEEFIRLFAGSDVKKAAKHFLCTERAVYKFMNKWGITI